MKALRELMSSSNANKSDKSDQSLNLKRPGWNVHLASYSKSTVVSTLHKVCLKINKIECNLIDFNLHLICIYLKFKSSRQKKNENLFIILLFFFFPLFDF